MAQKKPISEKLTSAVADAIKFAAARNEQLQNGESAISKAQEIENRDFSNGGGFEKGDVVVFPTSVEELEASCLLAGEKSVSFMIQIERGGKPIYVRTYAQWFTLSVHPVVNGTEDIEKWIRHKGTFAENARVFQGSIYDLFKSFIGKKVKVVSVERLGCMVVKKGQKAPNPATGKFDMEPGRRKFYTFEEVQ